jgi:hypothetical protein
MLTSSGQYTSSWARPVEAAMRAFKIDSIETNAKSCWTICLSTLCRSPSVEATGV